ncbi:hypothetical protein ZWY2020_006339 [Hordeum vulgare]|nr:hypothetical protein ZWY2020_006339 [Hordeum vulgare]
MAAVAAKAKKKKWFIMYAIPKVADEMSTEFPNASFTFNKAPLLSHLAVSSNVAIPAGNIDYPFIVATDSVPLASCPFDGYSDRCLKVSDGSLRYVQIHGDAPEKLRVTMWTLSSNNPADAIWQETYKASFVDIWDHKNYKTPLRARVVPMVALVHPMKARMVYFFLDKHIFRVNLEKSRVSHRVELSNLELPVLSSLMLHAWKLPVGATKNHSYGRDDFNVHGVHFLTLYDSVEDFLDKATGVMRRSCPELFDMDLDDLDSELEVLEEDEEDEEDHDKLSEDD